MQLEHETVYSEDLENAFGEPLQDSDVQSAFDTIDKNQEKRIRLRNFKNFCVELNLEDEDVEEIFTYIDIKDNRYFGLDEFRQFLEDPPEESWEFCQKLLGAYIYDPAYKSENGEISMELIKISLSALTANWQSRIDNMQSFARQMANIRKKAIFVTTITKMTQFLILQLKDRRTLVHRHICICIAKLVQENGNWCQNVSARLLKALFEFGVRGNVQIACDSAAQCCLAIIQNVPESRKNEITNTILNGCKEKNYPNVRICGFTLLSVLISENSSDKDHLAKPLHSEWWTKVTKCVGMGCNDINQNVRDNAYKCLYQLELLVPAHVIRIIRNFKKTQNMTYSNHKLGSCVFQLTRSIFFNTFEVPSSFDDSNQMSPSDNSMLSPRAIIDFENMDSSEEKEEEFSEEEPIQIKKKLINTNSHGSAIVSTDSNLGDFQGGDDHGWNRTPTKMVKKNARTNTKEILISEIEKLKNELREERITNSARIELLMSEFAKVSFRTEEVEKKHDNVIEQMKHQNRSKIIQMDERNQSRIRRIQQNAESQVSAVIRAIEESSSLDNIKENLRENFRSRAPSVDGSRIYNQSEERSMSNFPLQNNSIGGNVRDLIRDRSLPIGSYNRGGDDKNNNNNFRYGNIPRPSAARQMARQLSAPNTHNFNHPHQISLHPLTNQASHNSSLGMFPPHNVLGNQTSSRNSSLAGTQTVSLNELKNSTQVIPKTNISLEEQMNSGGAYIESETNLYSGAGNTIPEYQEWDDDSVERRKKYRQIHSAKGGNVVDRSRVLNASFDFVAAAQEPLFNSEFEFPEFHENNSKHNQPSGTRPMDSFDYFGENSVLSPQLESRLRKSNVATFQKNPDLPTLKRDASLKRFHSTEKESVYE